MNKIYKIFLIIILLISTTGLTISLHYSGRDLYSTSVTSKAESCCKSPCDCCREMTIHQQVEDEFLTSINNIKNTQIQKYKYLSKSESQSNLNFEFSNFRTLFFAELNPKNCNIPVLIQSLLI